MAGDLNREASELWNSLKPIIDKEIDARTQGMVQRRKAKVTTAPSLATNTIGVTEPFGTEMFLPFNTNIMSASVGDFVWVEYMYGMTNAFVSMFASADDKNQYVAGNLTVGGVLDVTKRRCQTTLSSTGWYRVMNVNTNSADASKFSTAAIIDINIGTSYLENNNGTHKISLHGVFNSASFVGEESKSNYMLVDKVRYTYDSSGNGHIDIRYIGTGENQVWCSFTVHVPYNNQHFFVAERPTNVVDSPSGETVMTEYTFNANGMGDLNVNGIVTGQGFADLLFGVGSEIASNTDCDDLTTAGKYTCPSQAVGNTLSHAPFSSAFGMFVFRVASAERLVQLAMPNSNDLLISVRYYNGTSWTAWKTLTPS